MKWLTLLSKYIAPTLFLRNTKTVHYVFSFLLLLAMAVGMASVVGTDRTTIVLESDAGQVEAGETFSLDVYAVATTPVNAVSIVVTTPTDYVEVLGIDRGESVITLWTNDPVVTNGAVSLEGGTYRRGFVGKHLIATINLRAKKPGQATMITTNASLLAGDGRGSEVRTDIANARESVAIAEDSGDEGTITADATVLIVTDLDGDGVVSLTDVSTFMGEWFRQNNRYDFNNDGVMSFKDFSILLANYFKSAS